MSQKKSFWVSICLFNLIVVAVYGVLMRYKIGFEFPHFDQKNLQHAHSHFAFSGWISLLLMVLISKSITNKTKETNIGIYNWLFGGTLITAWGMLISFTIQGYGFFSILFSVLSLILSFLFSWKVFEQLKSTSSFTAKKWFYGAIIFNLISSFGTFYLMYMTASGTVEQRAYLGSVYWYLHFQYNGWFLFASIGLFIDYLFTKNIRLKHGKTIFALFFLSCIPSYGLSVLWLDLSVWIYIFVVIAAIAQTAGQLLFLKEVMGRKSEYLSGLNFVHKSLLLCVLVAFTIKIMLQLGSTIPYVSKLAFGFRPIVIAYLHLVLLALISVFLVAYSYLNGYISNSLGSRVGMILFLFGILLNELVLATQGILSFSYTIIPNVNTILFAISLIIFLGLVVLNISEYKYNKNHSIS